MALVTRTHVARAFLLLATIATAWQCHESNHEPFLAIVPIDVVAIWILTRRRWRAATMGWLALAAAMGGLQASDGGTIRMLPIAALHLAALVALSWPRSVPSPRPDLPQLPLLWVITATGIVTTIDVGLLWISNGSVRQGMPAIVSAAFLLFGGFAMASRAGVLRDVAGVVAAVVSILLPSNVTQPHDQGWVALSGAVAFALFFPWLRAHATPLQRGLWTWGTCALAGLLPMLAMSPAQVIGIAPLVKVLVHAGGFALALALAPRIAGAPRVWRSSAWFASPPRGFWLLAIGLTLLGLYDTRSRATGTIVVCIVFVATTVAMCVRSRVSQLAVTLAFCGGVVVAGDAVHRLVWQRYGVDDYLTIAAVVIVGFVGAFVLTGGEVARHFPRRWVVTSSAGTSGHVLAGFGALVLAIGLRVDDAVERQTTFASLSGPVRVPQVFPWLEPTFPAEGDTGPGVAGSTIASDPIGRGTWVVDEENDAVVLVNAMGVTRSFPVGAWPQLLVTDAAGTVFVTCRGDASVYRIDRDFQSIHATVGPEPRGLALAADGRHVAVGLVSSKALLLVNTASLEVSGRRTLEVEPYIVARMEQAIAALPRRGGSVALVAPDLSSEQDVPLDNGGRTAWHGAALVPAGRDLLVLHATVDTGLSAPVSSGGYGGTVSEPVEQTLTLVRAGQPWMSRTGDLRRQIPRVVDPTAALLRGGRLFVASRGTDQLVSVSLPIDDKEIQTVPLGGASGVAIGASGAVVGFGAFDRSFVELASGKGTPRRLKIGGKGMQGELAEGRRLFHRLDRSISASGMTCATCHPDGTQDGLVWRLRGEVRQTPSLAGRLVDTAPYNWEGTSKTLVDNLHQTVSRLGGSGLKPEEARALSRYLVEGLRRAPSAVANDPALVARGRALFDDAQVGCAGCHPSDAAFTDSENHDVGTFTDRELADLRKVTQNAVRPDLQTPSLVDVARTAPYLHDGSARDLPTLLANNGDRMGMTSQLAREDLRALVAYLETL